MATINYDWSLLETAPGKAYQYPASLTPFIRQKYSGPAIYRWSVYGFDGRLSEVYFGETERLSLRLAKYVTPGKREGTNHRLKSILEKAIAKGSRVEFQVLCFKTFKINHATVVKSSLHQDFIRKMLENFLIADFLSDSDSAGCEVLNAKGNPIERRLRRATRRTSA